MKISNKRQKTLKLQILSLLAGCLINLVFVIFVMQVGTRKLATSYSELAEVQLPATRTANSVMTSLNSASHNASKVFADSSSQDEDQLEDALDDLELSADTLELYFDELKEIDLKPQLKQLILDINPKLEDFFEVIKAILSLREANTSEEAKANLYENFLTIYSEVQDAISILGEDLETDVSNTLATGSKWVWLNRFAGTGMGLLSILIQLAFGFVAIRRIRQSLIAVSEKINTNSIALEETTQELTSASQSLNQLASEQTESLNATIDSMSSVESMTEANIQKAIESNQQFDKVRSMSLDGLKSTESLEDSMKDILHSNQKIQDLTSAMTEIANKTQLIDEIVFQTKLLSFNASVEAERAGEHGRGFAVVAQEIGILAQQSGKNAVEISTKVKSCLELTSNVAGENRANVERGNQTVSSVSCHLKQITEAAENVAIQFEEIVNASKQQRSAVDQTKNELKKIELTTENSTRQTKGVSSAIESLGSQADQLGSSVHKLDAMIGTTEERQKPTSPEIT